MCKSAVAEACSCIDADMFNVVVLVLRGNSLRKLKSDLKKEDLPNKIDLSFKLIIKGMMPSICRNNP